MTNTPQGKFETLDDAVHFLTYCGLNSERDICVFQEQVSKGYGYFEVYARSGRCKRKTSLSPTLVDDYVVAALKEDDENPILNLHLAHLGDDITWKISSGWLNREPITTVDITRKYGWRENNDVRVIMQYHIPLKGVDEYMVQIWQEQVKSHQSKSPLKVAGELTEQR